MATVVPGAFNASAQAEGVVQNTQMNISQSSGSYATMDNEKNENEAVESTSSEERDGEITSLAKTFTGTSHRRPDGEHVNPFMGSDNPLLDPQSEKFSPREWVKTLVGISSRDPERYPTRRAGISYRNLNVHGYGVPTDYQKSFGNYPLEVVGLFKSLIGRSQKTKIQILRDFDGLVRSGEMLVVLGRPGR